MTVGLCLLVWNEREGCVHDLPLLPLTEFDQVFAIDGGSTDGTTQLLTEAGVHTFQQRARGYNAAYIEAFEHCSCDALVIFPPKGNIDPTATLAIRRELEAGADLVIASRIIKGSVNEEDSKLLKPRKWFVEGLGFIASLLWNAGGYRVRDVLHGFRGMRCDAFRQLTPRTEGLSIDLEMVVGSYQRNFTRVEVPVQEAARLAGTTHFKALPTGWKLLKYMMSELLQPAVASPEPAAKKQ